MELRLPLPCWEIETLRDLLWRCVRGVSQEVSGVGRIIRGQRQEAWVLGLGQLAGLGSGRGIAGRTTIAPGVAGCQAETKC